MVEIVVGIDLTGVDVKELETWVDSNQGKYLEIYRKREITQEEAEFLGMFSTVALYNVIHSGSHQIFEAIAGSHIAFDYNGVRQIEKRNAEYFLDGEYRRLVQ
jgi:hypothetical protein